MHQRLDRLDRGCLRQLSEDVTQIGVGFEAVELGGLDQGVDVSGGLRTVYSIAEQLVVAPNHQRSDGHCHVN